MIIYQIENIINGKIYIGQTIQKFKNRIRAHKHDALNAKYPIQRAIAKYGFDNFTFKIICECTNQSELNLMERFFIWAYGSAIQELGYNLELGGNKGKSVSNKSRQKMSAAQIMRFAKPEEKEKHSIIMKRRFSDPKEKENTSKTTKEAMKKFCGENHPNSMLTWKAVSQIREEYKTLKTSQRKLAKKFHTSQRNILDILKNRTWKVI